MPKWLEDKLKQEYPGNDHAVWGTLNAIGAVHGNVETAKGRAMTAKHNRDMKAGTASGQHPHQNLGKYLHPKKSR